MLVAFYGDCFDSSTDKFVIKWLANVARKQN